MFCVRLSVAGVSALRNAIPAVTPGAAHVMSKITPSDCRLASTGSTNTPLHIDGESNAVSHVPSTQPPKKKGDVPAHLMPNTASRSSTGFQNKPAEFNGHLHDRPNYPMGQTATPSLHTDLPPAVFDDLDRKSDFLTDDWRSRTDRRKRKGVNDLNSYMVLSAGGAVTMYLAKYTLYGAVMLLGPSRDKYAAGAVEVDISTIPEGKNAVFVFRGKPLFIRHRTQEEIVAAQNQDVGSLRDPQTDEERCKNQKYLICIGVCTHLGCVPISHAGGWKGYFCPCHGSHYDTCGRIMKGPAPLNLEVPEYEYLDDSLVLIGK